MIFSYIIPAMAEIAGYVLWVVARPGSHQCLRLPGDGRRTERLPRVPKSLQAHEHVQQRILPYFSESKAGHDSSAGLRPDYHSVSFFSTTAGSVQRQMGLNFSPKSSVNTHGMGLQYHSLAFRPIIVYLKKKRKKGKNKGKNKKEEDFKNIQQYGFACRHRPHY